MTAFVDTNVLVRHVTGDPPDRARRATAYLAGADRLFLVDLVVAETTGIAEVASFDRSIDRVSTVVRVEP
jgi:predicted nucleic acid-binding protein